MLGLKLNHVSKRAPGSMEQGFEMKNAMFPSYVFNKAIIINVFYDLTHQIKATVNIG